MVDPKKNHLKVGSVQELCRAFVGVTIVAMTKESLDKCSMFTHFVSHLKYVLI